MIRTMTRRAVLSLAAFALVVSACAGEASLHGVVRETPLEVGTLALTDVTLLEQRAGGIVEDGRLVMRAAEQDRLLIVYFGFLNCPDVCPTTLADLRSALTQLDAGEAERVDLAFVTVDPDRDGPEELAAYLRHFAQLHHAVRPTGEELAAALAAFLASASVEVAEDGSVDVAHSAVLYGVDHAGRVVVEWPFGTSASALADDLRILLTRTGTAGA
jgi:protein SCO1/2